MKAAIIGAGKLGRYITEALLNSDIEVTLIDQNPDVLQKVSSQLDLLTVQASGEDILTLKKIKIHTYDFVIATTDNDEKNIVICRFAKELGCRKTIARIRDPQHVNQLEFIKKAGDIDYVVNPDHSIANEIYKYLVEKYSLSNGILNSGNTGVLEFSVEKLPVLAGKKLKDVAKILDYMLILAISRSGKILVPKGDTQIRQEDTLYVLGYSDSVQKLAEIVHDKNAYTNLQRVMIAGGGKTGYYLAKQLNDFGITVKIIDIDKTRCQYLSEQLSDVLVLHGDATDVSFLEEEDLDKMDAFVSVTGFDEENLLLALTATQHNVEDVVAKISRRSYGTLVEQMGVSMALNPLEISAANVLRFVQGTHRIISSQLIQGQAEFMEIQVDKNMKITDTPLSQVTFPEGAILAAIHRGKDSIIPNGSTMIQEGDRVVAFCLLSQTPALEKLFQQKSWPLNR